MEAAKDKKLPSYMLEDLAISNIDVLVNPTEESLPQITYDKKTLAIVRVGLMVFFVLGSLMLLPFIVVGYTKMVAINSDISIIQYENRELNKQVDNLETKIKPYISRTRIENIAKNRLNMVFPGKDNFEYIDRGLEEDRVKDGKLALSPSNSN